MSGNQTQTPEGKERRSNAGSDSEAEDDVFHDARFPAEEEAVSPHSPCGVFAHCFLMQLIPDLG